VFSKEEYLGAVAAGILHYLAWNSTHRSMFGCITTGADSIPGSNRAQGARAGVPACAILVYRCVREARRPVADRVVTGHGDRLRQ
jgi:hypothetical protein